MAKRSLAPNHMTVPDLAKLVGISNQAIYDAIGCGRGPALTPCAGKEVPQSVITLDAAIAWVRDRVNSPWVMNGQPRKKAAERMRRHYKALDELRLRKAALYIEEVKNRKPAPKRKRPPVHDLGEKSKGIPLGNFAVGGRA
jgi:predicted DNA-binding transcriptional regulator AlpA